MRRPVLRYHGGKWRLAPWIISNFPSHDVYTEVFGGAASVLLRKPRSRGEVYNDIDSGVVNVFRVLRDHDKAKELKRLLELTPFSREEYELSGDEHYQKAGEIEKARLTIIRSFMGFGGGSINHKFVTGFRAMSHREHDGGAANDWNNYSHCIPAFTERFKKVVVENKHYRDVLIQQDSINALHYVDPPYVKNTRAVSTRNVYQFEMTDEDHEAMLNTLMSLQGMVVLSGYNCEMYNDLLKHWTKIERIAMADGAKQRVECLWLNKSAVERRRQQHIFQQS